MNNLGLVLLNVDINKFVSVYNNIVIRANFQYIV